MTATLMMERIAETSPRSRAGVAAGVYSALVAAILVQFFVRGDGAATVTFTLITLACDTAVAFIFYDLFEQVSGFLSFLAAAFRLVYVASMAVNAFIYFTPRVLFAGAYRLQLFSAEQLRAVALVSHGLYARGVTISLLFFGLHCLLIGYLAAKRHV
jgi:hypothetical protein